MSYSLKRYIRKLIQHSPIARMFFDVVRMVYIPPSFVRERLSFVGKFNLTLPNNSNLKLNHFGYYIENELYWMGLETKWEKQSIRIWTELSKSSTFIFDIGANTGIFSLLAKAYNSDSVVYAFEPQPNIYKCLVKQIELNQFNIQAINIALSNENGTSKFYNYTFSDDANSTAGSLNKEFRDLPGQHYIDVTTRTLTDFVHENKINRIDLIKMDVESFEPQVIKGGIDVISEHKPIMIIEIQDDQVGMQLSNMLKPLGYIYFNIDENRGLISVEELGAQQYKNHLLIPKTKSSLLQSFLLGSK
jgi:FkbM family methyltransferase